MNTRERDLLLVRDVDKVSNYHFSLKLNIATIEGAIAAILCWYQDEDTEMSWKSISKMIKHVSKIAKCDFSNLDGNQLWYLYDALGTYPERDELLEKVYLAASETYYAAAREERAN